MSVGQSRGQRRRRGGVRLRLLSRSSSIKYRGQKGALIPLLQGTQAVYGFVPKEAMIRIAEALGEPSAGVSGWPPSIAQFRLVPRGKNVVRVCHGTACHVSGLRS